VNQTNGFESKLREMIEKALKERAEGERKRAEGEAQIKAAETKLVAYQTTLRDYKSARGETLEPEMSLDYARFNGKTVRQCCRMVLTDLGGKGKVSQIAKTLQTARKLTANYKTAYAQVCAALARKPEFRKTGPGEYELVKQE